ncbi:MAG: hypothetical protein AAFU79_28665 [Myxococcota bacterium]
MNFSPATSISGAAFMADLKEELTASRMFRGVSASAAVMAEMMEH